MSKVNIVHVFVQDLVNTMGRRMQSMQWHQILSSLLKFRVPKVSEKVREIEKSSRSGKSQGILNRASEIFEFAKNSEKSQ